MYLGNAIRSMDTLSRDAQDAGELREELASLQKKAEEAVAERDQLRSQLKDSQASRDRALVQLKDAREVAKRQGADLAARDEKIAKLEQDLEDVQYTRFRMGAAEILKAVRDAGMNYKEFLSADGPDWLAEEEEEAGSA